MTTTTLTLKTIEVVSKRIPRKGKKLGQMLVFNEDITEIKRRPQLSVPSSQPWAAPALGFLFPCAKARYVAL